MPETSAAGVSGQHRAAIHSPQTPPPGGPIVPSHAGLGLARGVQRAQGGRDKVVWAPAKRYLAPAVVARTPLETEARQARQELLLKRSPWAWRLALRALLAD